MTNRYAAYDDYSIYALATSPSDAIANARRDTGKPDETFETARVSDALAAQIDEHGWCGISQSFALVDGYLVDTTWRTLSGNA